MPIDQPVQFDIVVVFAEGIYQHLGNLQPSDIKAKLKKVQNPVNVEV